MTTRETMNGKPVFTVPARSIINFESGFQHKLLCDGPTFSTGSACVYSCTFCYVEDLMRKLRAHPLYHQVKGSHSDIVIRRAAVLGTLRGQLTDRHGHPKFLDMLDTRVIYSSPLVDVAANMELARETIEVCKIILELTNWQIRLLSKSNLLPVIAKGLPEKWKARVIYGVSTGTLDDQVAQAIEVGTPRVSKRLASLHWLQDNGYRTFGMVCPSLPQLDYLAFAKEAAAAIRADRCEHVWAEVINIRGESFTRTRDALRATGRSDQADYLAKVMGDRSLWEYYARQTFLAHARVTPKGKLRFLQYVTPESRPWWEARQSSGAVLL